MIIREAERVERKEKQRVLEERWKLIRWLAEFIDTNRERSEKKGKEINIEKWEKLEQD